MEPMAAKNEPMIKVVLMTEFSLIPISSAVSKSLDTARIAIPIFVCLIKNTRASTKRMVKNGVIMVTRFVMAPIMFTVSEIHGIEG